MSNHLTQRNQQVSPIYRLPLKLLVNHIFPIVFSDISPPNKLTDDASEDENRSISRSSGLVQRLRRIRIGSHVAQEHVLACLVSKRFYIAVSHFVILPDIFEEKTSYRMIFPHRDRIILTKLDRRTSIPHKSTDRPTFGTLPTEIIYQIMKIVVDGSFGLDFRNRVVDRIRNSKTVRFDSLVNILLVNKWMFFLGQPLIYRYAVAFAKIPISVLHHFIAKYGVKANYIHTLAISESRRGRILSAFDVEDIQMLTRLQGLRDLTITVSQYTPGMLRLPILPLLVALTCCFSSSAVNEQDFYNGQTANDFVASGFLEDLPHFASLQSINVSGIGSIRLPLPDIPTQPTHSISSYRNLHIRFYQEGKPEIKSCADWEGFFIQNIPAVSRLTLADHPQQSSKATKPGVERMLNHFATSLRSLTLDNIADFPVLPRLPQLASLTVKAEHYESQTSVVTPVPLLGLIPDLPKMTTLVELKLFGSRLKIAGDFEGRSQLNLHTLVLDRLDIIEPGLLVMLLRSSKDTLSSVRCNFNDSFAKEDDEEWIHEYLSTFAHVAKVDRVLQLEPTELHHLDMDSWW
ncbi:hypothetical protein BT69DRAFT_1293766 [Atractiella rhizophila]|nr:hypothetical protein BT69DRAFT_1293766 [Atractiella rhizophila]